MWLMNRTRQYPMRGSARDGSPLLHVPLPPPPTLRQDELWDELQDECGQTCALNQMPTAMEEVLPNTYAERQTPQSWQELDGQSDGFSSDDDAMLLLGESLHDLESASDGSSTEDESD